MPGIFVPPGGSIQHKLFWQLKYLRPRSLESLRYRIWYCWARAQGNDTITVVHAGPFGPLPARPWYHLWHWTKTIYRFVTLGATYLYRRLPELQCLIRYGPFMMVQRRQWSDFENRELDGWPEVKRKVIAYHYTPREAR